MSQVTVFGLNAVEAVLSSPRVPLIEVAVREGNLSGRLQELVSRAKAARVPVKRVGRDHLDRLAGPVVHQGVAAILREWPYLDDGDLFRGLASGPGKPFLLVLDHLHDVGNFGAIIRSAHLCGVGGIIVPKHRAAPVTSAVVRASAGAAAFVGICQVPNLSGTIRDLKKAGVWVFALEADEGPSLLETDLNVPLALVLGGEHGGISRLVRENCDQVTHLPMAGKTGSYNASVAAGIAMFEVMRQRLAAGGVKRGRPC